MIPMPFTTGPTDLPRRTVPVALFAVVALVVAAGAVAATAAYFELRPSPSPPGAMTVTDDTGRSIAVPHDPSRVAVLAPSITDTMFRLGLRSHIVAVDCYAPAFGGITADYTPGQIVSWNLSAAMCVQTGPALNIEQLLNASPQLVLVSTIVSVADVEEVQATYHIPTLVVQPSTIGGILADVDLLGQIFGVTPTANTLVGQMQTVLATAQDVAANLSAPTPPIPFPTLLVTYYADQNGYWTYGPGTFGQSLIELVSAVSIAASSPIAYPELSGSQVLADDPTGIIYATGFGENLSLYQSGPQWSSFGAVGSNHVWAMDSTLLTEADPTMILSGVPQLLELLHPGVA